MDPAAIGTAIIGIDSIRREEAADRHGRAPRSVATHTRRASARRQLAATLRTVATRIDPTPAPAR